MENCLKRPTFSHADRTSSVKKWFLPRLNRIKSSCDTVYHKTAFNASNPRDLYSRDYTKELTETNYLVIIILRAEKSHQERSSLSGGGVLVEHAGLNDLLIHIQLVSGGSQDLLLHAVDSHQSQHSHFILLTDTMSAILGLQILVKQNKQSVTEGEQCLKSQV